MAVIIYSQIPFECVCYDVAIREFWNIKVFRNSLIRLLSRPVCLMTNSFAVEVLCNDALVAMEVT